MRTSPQPRRAKRSLPNEVIDPSRGGGGLLHDACSFAALAVFIAGVVWFAATAGELVALWRLGSGQ